MTKDAIIAVNRFGLGARPGDLNAVAAGPRDWLLDQIEADSAMPPGTGSLPHSSELLSEINALRADRRETRRSQADDEPAPDIVREYGAFVRRNYVEQVTARYRAAAVSETPFLERLVHFWSNHFAVSGDKQPLPAIACLYENEAIRPHVTGQFEDLLIAAVRHPAMILYLDNQRSVGPNSRLASRAQRFRPDQEIGLNENLAREILELHTLGVDGGYGQQDVTSFAHALTGWSVGGGRGRFSEGEPGRFEFREAVHEPGAQSVAGKSYRQEGVAQGEAILKDLARHPSTASFVSTKLARHFVADNPPDALVARLADTWQKTDGNLPAVYAELVGSEEAFASIQSKYKSPHDFVVSTLRAFNHVPDDGRFLLSALDLMGQTPFRPGSPEGWPDTALQWGGADALYKRVEWAGSVGRLAGVRVNPVELGDAVLGSAFSADTRTAVSRAESVSQGTALLLASPDFQRR